MSTAIVDASARRDPSADRGRKASWSFSPDPGRRRYSQSESGAGDHDRRPRESRRRRSSSAPRRPSKLDREPRLQLHIDESMRHLRIRERAYDVNLATTENIHYEALLDDGLADFFSAPSVQRHLIRQGIIKPTGEVVDPKEFKCHQIEMDAHERELAIRRRQEEQTLNREVEVTLRRYFASSPNTKKILGGRKKPIVNTYAACPERLQTTANVYTNPNPLLDNVRRLLQECEERATRRARARQRKVNAAKASTNRTRPATVEGSADAPPRRKRATTTSPRRTESDVSAAPKSWTIRSQSAGSPMSGTRRGRRPGSSRGNRDRSTAAYGTPPCSRLREEFGARDEDGQAEDYLAAGDVSSLADEAVETDDAESLVDEAVGTDVSEIPVHQAYRPHTAPAHRGQVVIQGDWSESEFGTPTESRSATRPPSAQPTLSTEITFEEDPETLSSAVLGIAAPASTRSETPSEKIPSIRGQAAGPVGV